MSAPTLDELIAAERGQDTTGWGLRCRVGDHADPAWPPPGVVSCSCPCHKEAAAARLRDALVGERWAA